MLKNLKLLRQATGISQRQLSEAIGVSQQSINKYENHNIEPDIDTMIRIADYFQTSVDYLIGHTDIQRKIEIVQEYELNSNESKFIELYRTLTEHQQKCITAVMESYKK